MPIYLPFDETYHYKDDDDGIIIPVSLTDGRQVASTFAVVDTGAAVCLFSRETGEMLGLDIEQGEYKRLGGLTGTLEAFGHEISIQTLNITVHSIVYFARHTGLPRNLLGRRGWIRKLRLGLIDYDNLFYLSQYGA